MTPVKKLLAFFCLLVLVVLACSFTVDLGTPSAAAGASTLQISISNQISTRVAQTLQALTQAALSATPTNTPLAIFTMTPTNTPMPPTLTVSSDTNCYAGPGSNYGFVITLHPGTIAIVIGKYSTGDYWIIDAPNYPGTTCWLSGQYAAISGDTGGLAELQPTVIAIPYTLGEPRNLHVSCTSQSTTSSQWWGNGWLWTVNFRWANTDNDQTGVRVYRNGRQIAKLGAHATSYTDIFFHHDKHEEVVFGVQAFNSYEISSIMTITLTHCS